jgi:hypothetical protein
MAVDKSALMSGKTAVLSLIGWILTIIGSLGILFVITDYNSYRSGLMSVIIPLLFFIGGCVVLVKASNSRKTAKKYRRYIDLVVNQNITNLDTIIASTGLARVDVLEDLQNMINIGYLKQAYINHTSNELVLQQFGSFSASAHPEQSSVVTIAKRCDGCGANNIVVVGKVSECEYCGNLITG